MATYGYARACKEDLMLDRQHEALAAAGVPASHVVAEHGAGTYLRPGLEALLGRLVPGDTVAVWTLACLGPDAGEVARAVGDLDRRGARLVVTSLGLDTAAPAGRLVLAALAQIAPPEGGGGRADRGTGAPGVGRRGRPHRLTPGQAAEARRLVREEGRTYDEVAAAFGVSRSAMWHSMNELPPPAPAAL